MKDQPWSKFFWSDWDADEGLRQCSLTAQGLWMRMLCICAKGEPHGFLCINGQPLDSEGIARSVGVPVDDVESLMAELARWGVFSRDRKGRIYSRRMVKDEQKSKIARKNGKTGGNPSLRNKKGNSASDNQLDKGRDKTQKPEARSQIIETSYEVSPEHDIEDALSIYQEKAREYGLPSVRSLNSQRRRALKARLKEEGLEGWRAVLDKLAVSSFLRGDRSDWRANFDFFTQKSSFIKALEGQYDDSPNKPAGTRHQPGERAERDQAIWERVAARHSGAVGDCGQDRDQARLGAGTPHHGRGSGGEPVATLPLRGRDGAG